MPADLLQMVTVPLWLLVTAVLLVVCAGLALRRRWVSPSRQLIAAAERMAQGQWHARVETHRGAESLRVLASRMNLLASQAQQQLDEISQQRRDLRALVDALPDAILVSDAGGRVRLMNLPAARLLQLSPQQVLGQKIVSVVNDEALLQLLDAAALPADTKLRPEQQEIQREVRLVRGGQRLTFQAVATGTAAGGVLLVLRDISAMAVTVAMKTDFVANASHELRTPLAAIKIAVETLKDAWKDDPDQSERCVSIIEGHVRRLEEILRDLLDLSRLESPDVQPKIDAVVPRELFAVVRSTLGPAARHKGVELVFEDAPPALAGFRSDERLLHLVLKNLVENSIKFTPAGGRVSVSLAPSHNGHSPGEPSTPHPNGATELRVTDTGIGIPPEHLDRVFERFYQVDAARSGTAGRGTGLGLAIVKHAVAALGGTVRLESEVGRGTVVTCVLPQKGD